MTLWNRFEQNFKHKQLFLLEKILGRPQLCFQDFDSSAVKRILIIRQHDQLGDFLLSTPAFRAVRLTFPDAHISLLARKYTTQLLENNWFVDNVITFYENGRDWNYRYFVSLWKNIRSKYDLVIVLNTVSHSLTSDFIAHLSNAKYVVGPDHLLYKGTSRNFFYNLLSPYRQAIVSQSQRNIDIVSPIGCETKNLSQEIFLTKDEKKQARACLKSSGWDGINKLVAIHPGAGKLGNRWPVENFASVAEKLWNNLKCAFFITWGPGEEELGKELTKKMNVPCFTAVEKNIRKFAGVLSQAHLLICNDTGVMHVGAAVGTPLVAIFGPTDPKQWKPVGELFMAIRGENKTCKAVSPNQVFRAANLLLRNV
jgi:ADP-heptose:LPS heptosyltransferase